jgi:hypothetical protein
MVSIRAPGRDFLDFIRTDGSFELALLPIQRFCGASWREFLGFPVEISQT